MTAKLTAAVTLLVSDAVLAWESLTLAQRSALRRCHTDGCARVRVDCHARTVEALRRGRVLVPLDSDRGKRDLSELGVVIRSAGMQAESDRGRKRSGR